MIMSHKRSKVFSITNSRQPGFTILELLLGAIIVALIGTGLFQSLAHGITLYQRAVLMGSIQHRTFSVFDHLEEDLSAALQCDLRNIDPQWISFQGQPQDVRFLIRTDHGIRSVEYSLEEDSQTKRFLLRRSERDINDLIKKIAPLHDGQIIAKELPSKAVTFAYALLQKQQEGVKSAPVWSQQWDQIDLPKALKVTLIFGSGGSPSGVKMERIFYFGNPK